MGVTFHNMVHFGVPSLVTDHNFFSFFGFPLKEGDIETAFSGTNNAIITESAARKYFPDEDPIGQRIVSHGYDFFISGIMYLYGFGAVNRARRHIPHLFRVRLWREKCVVCQDGFMGTFCCRSR